ncbi:hypothetical protein S83_032312, partial [Arachis hypogaea]
VCKGFYPPLVRKSASRHPHRARPPWGRRQRHVPLGGQAPYCWSANERRAHASLLAQILTYRHSVIIQRM